MRATASEGCRKCGAAAGERCKHSREAKKRMWYYQIMKHGEVYSVHEYYPINEDSDGDGWTEMPITLDGSSVEDIKDMLTMIRKDIKKHGVRDYETGEIIDDQENPRDD